MTFAHPIGGLALGTGRFRIDALDEELAWIEHGDEAIDRARRPEAAAWT